VAPNPRISYDVPGTCAEEFQATDEALRHLTETGDRDQEIAAYKVLYPAYGTYAGSYIFIIGGPLIGALVGHLWGRAKARSQRKYYEQMAAQHAA